MPVLRIALDPEEPDPAAVRKAADVLDRGGLLAFPTETVYGLGARGDLPEAMERLKSLKGREERFTLHIGDGARLPGSLEVSTSARRLMDRFWPGPLTLVLPDGKGATLGVRFPAHPAAQALLKAAGGPVYASSANPRGGKPPASADAVEAHFGDRIDALVDAGKAVLDQASTVVKVEGNAWTLLREGLLTRDMIARALARRVLFVCTGNSCRSPMARALFELAAAKRLGVRPADLLSEGLLVESAGTSAFPVGGASEHARKIVKERGGDLSRHVPTPLTAEMLERADEVYVMSRVHADRVARLSPRAGAHARLLAADGGEMADPIGGSEEEYRECARQIEKGIGAVLERSLSVPRAREAREKGGTG